MENKRFIYNVYLSFLTVVMAFSIIYLNIPRIIYEKVGEEYHIINYYGNQKKVTIPSTYKNLPVTKIETRAFEGKKLEIILFEEDSNLELIGRLSFNNCKKLKEVVLPDSMIEIENHAFQNCISLISFTCNDNLLFIGGSSFIGCSSLEVINFGKNLYSIGSYAFYDCRALKGIYIPNTCSYIYNNAFAYCDSLSKAVICENTLIYEDAFIATNVKIEYYK